MGDFKGTWRTYTIKDGLPSALIYTIMQDSKGEIVKQLKRNKAYRDTIGGLHIVALDDSEYFRSESIHCDECLEYHLQTKDGIVTHYVHN
ncbi:MAG: hypothetical protein ACE5PV_07885 [Candidatus Poribacteria bacterium]